MKKTLVNALCCCVPVPKYRRNLRRSLYKRYVHIQMPKYSVENNSFADAYGAWLDDMHNNKSHFVPFTDRPYNRRPGDVKIFAYYLAQFHAIPENDDAHGKGFTEWTNVASCAPQFVGHYQPHVPYDVGFYNLNDVNVMRRQVEIAKSYGVYGFCFYYYWFSGKKVLEKPLYNFLNSDIDFPFHFCWANENWSKLWDGGNKEVILRQEVSDMDADGFFADILPFIQDARYEKIENKPLLMIYNPKMFDPAVIKKFLNRLDELAIQNGFDGFFFMASNAFDFKTPVEYGLNGIIEFPPHCIRPTEMEYQRISKNANLHICDMKGYIQSKDYLYKVPYTLFKCCFPRWDNSARKTYSNGFCFMMDDSDFAQWLSDIIIWTKANNLPTQQYVYINAWNEWGEGAHLEPDVRYGYRSLQIVKDCMEKFQK
ncbi:glycosyl hydrolase [bacterium]|nr:glycosyl hydrolase [bacterium]